MALTLCFKLSFFTLISSITYTEKAVLDKSSLGADAAKKLLKTNPKRLTIAQISSPVGKCDSPIQKMSNLDDE